MLPEPLALNPTNRFSNRAENYSKYRPAYPLEIVPFLEKSLGLMKEHRIADIGSGTGLFGELLLQKGYSVLCIEPNEEMRKAAEKKLSHYDGFSSRKYRSEKTGLRNRSVDLITVAQAFHWMDPEATKKEFNRVLKPGGHIVLAWHVRKTSTAFLKGYDELKQQFRTDDFRENIIIDTIRDFFAPLFVSEHSLENLSWLDFDALKGQLLSSSYIPLPGHNSYDTMISTLVQLFVGHEENGFVKMEYETKLFWGSDQE